VSEVLERVTVSTRTVPLSEAVEINPKPDRSLLSDNLDVSFVPMAMVEAGTGNIDATTVRKYAEVKKGYTYFRDGDVLFAKITPCMENGKMVVARNLHNGIGFGSTEFHVLRSRESVDPHYVYHFVASSRFRAEAAHHMTGAVGQKRVPTSFLERAEIPLPPIEDQRRIVAEIEKQFSRLDEAVANLKRVKANLKCYKAAVLKAAVEGRLVPTEAELARREGRNYESGAQLLQRILETRRSQWDGKGKYKVPLALNTANRPELPEGWASVTIEQLLSPTKEAMKTGPFGSLLKKHEHQSEGIAVLGIENIQAMRFVRGSKIHITPQKAHDLEGYRVVPGDILLSRSGTVGEVCVVPDNIGDARISTNLIKVSLAKGGMLPEFFVLLFNGSPFVLNQVSDLCKGSTRDFLNQEILKQLCFILPPLAEQHRIVAEIDRRLSFVNEVESEVNANLKRTQALRHAVLQAAFSGQSGQQTKDGKGTIMPVKEHLCAS